MQQTTNDLSVNCGERHPWKKAPKTKLTSAAAVGHKKGSRIAGDFVMVVKISSQRSMQSEEPGATIPGGQCASESVNIARWLQVWFSFSFSKTGKERSPSSCADSEQELLFLLQKEDGISVPQLCGLRLHWEFIEEERVRMLC
ncbi:hypothetical protein Q9966_002441 [Columba livia]|nr:hypothetical protein Q9966_002441 [Columba livia]